MDAPNDILICTAVSGREVTLGPLRLTILLEAANGAGFFGGLVRGRPEDNRAAATARQTHARIGARLSAKARWPSVRLRANGEPAPDK